MNDFKNTELEIIERYNKRFAQHGESPLSLNWQDKKSQKSRFKNFLELVEIKNQDILDIGCGFGDFYEYLKECNIQPRNYTGIDINPTFIECCKKKYPSINFHVNNTVDDELPDGNFDIIFMVGIFSYNFKEFDNENFIKQVVTKAFNKAKHTLIFDMQSIIINKDYETANHIHYQKPSDILDFALSLTPHVILKHDYLPNPAREFIVLMKHIA